MEKKLVSIIISMYNVSEYLENCLSSILLQTYRNFEVIIVNDGSTDDSLKIAEKYVASDQRFKVYTKQNGGLSDTRNYGLKIAKGDYILWIDADDYLSLNYLQDCIQSAITNDADIIFTSVYFYYLKAKAKNRIITPNLQFDKLPIELINKNSPTIPTKLFKHQFIKDNDLKFEHHRYEDITFMAKALLKNPRVSGSFKAKYYYLQRPNSIMQSTDFKIKEIESALDSVYLASDLTNKEVKKQIDFLIVRNLLLASLNRTTKIKDTKLANQIIDSHWDFIQAKVPAWPNNQIILKNCLSKINYYTLKVQKKRQITKIIYKIIRFSKPR